MDIRNKPIAHFTEELAIEITEELTLATMEDEPNERWEYRCQLWGNNSFIEIYDENGFYLGSL